MKLIGQEKNELALRAPAGLAGLLIKQVLGRLRRARRPQPRLELLERISLAPKQSLALVEAEGRRFLVATSPEGAPAFFALDGSARAATHRAPRVSW
jgi:flagellar biogenesis protein FliO